MRPKDLGHRILENSRLLFLAVVALGGGATLIWGILASRWLVYARSYTGVVLEGCVEALALIKNYPPFAYLLLMFALLLGGLLYSTRQVSRKLKVSRLVGGGRLLDGGRDARLKEILERIETRRGAAHPVYLVNGRRPVCLVQGLIRPRILLSTSVCEHLTEEELEAAILHETYHLERRHPLKRLVAEGVADFLFFIPVVKRLVRQHTYAQELAADRFAAQRVADKHHLARAIVKMAAAKSDGFGSHLGHASLTDRLNRLLGRPTRRRRLGIASLVVSVVFILSVYAAPFAFGQPGKATQTLKPCAQQCISQEQTNCVSRCPDRR